MIIINLANEFYAEETWNNISSDRQTTIPLEVSWQNVVQVVQEGLKDRQR